MAKRGRHACDETAMVDLCRQLARYAALQIAFEAGFLGKNALEWAQKVLSMIGLGALNGEVIRQTHRRIERRIGSVSSEEVAAQLEGCGRAYFWLLEQEGVMG